MLDVSGSMEGERIRTARDATVEFLSRLPANAEADGVKIFPIAFGQAADQDVLNRIANVTGGRLFSADPTSISNVYLSISAEQ